PDAWAYVMVAVTYKSQGVSAGWKERLDEFVAEGQDGGLEQARVRVRVASEFMGGRLWGRAWQYAKGAGVAWGGWALEGGRGWAVERAQRCAEGMGNWKEAEVWVQRETERYPNSAWAAWFLFCKRTGHGDAGAARAAAEKYLQSGAVSPDAAGFFHWLTGEP